MKNYTIDEIRNVVKATPGSPYSVGTALLMLLDKIDTIESRLVVLENPNPVLSGDDYDGHYDGISDH